MATTENRNSRRREATRRRLLDATKVLIARQSVEATRIQEITEQADVGFGSFYNHFESKDAIVMAVVGETIAEQGAELDALIARIADPAEVIAAAHRTLVRRARSDPDWAWLLLHLDVSHNIVESALSPYAIKDLRNAISAERLKVPDESVAITAAGGALLAVMRAVLDGTASEQADIYHAEGILRMFGLPPDQASEVARRPLPKAT